MSQCMNCQKEIESDNLKVFGIVERYHYDNRRTTAETDLGPTEFTPIAIVRVGLCEECEKLVKDIALYGSIGMLFAGLALCGITILLALLIPGAAGAILCIGGFGGLILLIRGLYGTIKWLLNGKKKESPYTEGMIKYGIKKECVLYPPTNEDLNVENLKSNLVNRHDYMYTFLDEKDLMKPAKGTGRENSKRYAIDTLRTWYQEQDIHQKAEELKASEVALKDKWKCPDCNELNPNVVTKCIHCGAKKDS